MSELTVGYDVDTSKKTGRKFEREGITGVVKRYEEDKVSYPYIKVINTEDAPVKKHTVKALSVMFASGELLSQEADKLIALYLEYSGKTLKLGTILPRQVKPILNMFKGQRIIGMLDKNTILEGDYVYILSD